MKNIVGIVGGYYPYYSPGGKIAANVFNELSKEYNMTIIAQKNNFGLKKHEKINGIDVIRINDYNVMVHNFLENKIKKSNGILKAVYQLLLKFKQIINYGVRICRLESLSFLYINRVKRELKKIENKIDVLIPVSAPHEAVAAAVAFKVKHPEIVLIPYKLDRFAQGNSLYQNEFIRKIRYPKHIRREQKTLYCSDKMFALPPIADYYKNSNFEGKEKVLKTEHPLLVECTDITRTITTNKIMLTYAGSLDVNLRNPEYALKIFENTIDFQNDYLFTAYTFGNCSHILKKYENKLGKSFNNAGKISSELISIELAKTDILISIGNNSDSEVPSKLFEYLSYGKPIVHFYYNNNDAYIKYLKSYKNSLCLKMDDELIEENCRRFNQFCQDKKGVAINYSDVVAEFHECTPQYVAKQFKEVIEGCLSEFRGSVVVAHPNQQHSMRLAKALKDKGLLHTYMTTVFYKDNSFLERFLSIISKNKLSSKMNKKKFKELDTLTKKRMSLLGYIFYAMVQIRYSLSCDLYVLLTKLFGKKVYNFVRKNNGNAVVMYDYTAVSCFQKLKKTNPEIIRILDMSSAPVQYINEIITREEQLGNSKWFEKKRMRYKQQYCEYFSKELCLAQYFLSPSKFIDDLLVRYGVDKNNIFRAEYGVDLQEFSYNRKVVTAGEKVNFVYTGRIEGAKGIGYLIDAVDKLYLKRKDFCLHLIGRNFLDKTLFHGKEYICLHGHVDKKKLVEIYKEMHIFVMPSLWEGLSLSIFEAIASGMCSILSTSSGGANIAEELDVGISIAPNDAEELYKAMEYFLENRDEITRMSENCDNTLSDRSWESYYCEAGICITKILEMENVREPKES